MKEIGITMVEVVELTEKARQDARVMFINKILHELFRITQIKQVGARPIIKPWSDGLRLTDIDHPFTILL